jgi:hypothetical protein
MANKPLQSRAGRNVGIESLPVFLQAAGAPEVVIDNIPAQPAVSAPVTLMEAVESALRTPFTRGEESGTIFNKDVSNVGVGVYFEDDQGNQMLIAAVLTLAGSVAPLNLALTGVDANPFTPAKPLSLCHGEKLVARAATPAPIP